MPIIIASIIILVLALLFVIFLRVIFYMAFAPVKKLVNNVRRIPGNEQYNSVKEEMLKNIDELEKSEFEEITIKSCDNLKLFGRYFKREKEGVIEIDFHGYRGHALRDYCGGSAIAKASGISSILIDQRSHVNSEGKAITFGIRERYDALCWVRYVIERFGSDIKIILSGVSMGAATVLMASELDLPKNVVGIIADCPYSSPKDIICKVARNRGLSPAFFYPFIKLSAKLFAGIDIESASPIEAVKNTDIPILIIHGDDDRYVPYEMGKRVFEACNSQNKKFLTVKDAGHAISYFKDKELYTKTVNDFINALI